MDENKVTGMKITDLLRYYIQKINFPSLTHDGETEFNEIIFERRLIEIYIKN